ncbi:MAG TPA: hypothetical protein VHA76_00480 [Solirubrobacterales bacterium]|nr:hypothetical protein [Solirubrobacterales bacterium]
MSSTDSMAGARAHARTRAGSQARGWAVFAAVMLLIIGGLDALYGLAAILNNEIVIVGGHGVIVADVSTWGWVTLILGILLLLTGIGLLAENELARWVAIFLIAAGAVIQLAWFPAAPLWTILVVALSVVVVYQLTAHWDE